MDADVIVIGGGPAGCRAATVLAEAGKRVILMEKEKIGGRCLHKACIPTKAFAAAAGKPGFSWSSFREQIAGQIQGMQEGQTLILQSFGVKILFGEAKLLPDGAVSCGDRVWSAETVVLACGSVPRQPNAVRVGSDLSDTRVITTETLWDLEVLPEEMNVVGAGIAGCELACALAKAGVRVQLTEKEPEILPGWPAEMQAELRYALEDLGIEICTGEAALAVISDCSETDRSETDRSETVLYSTGRLPDRSVFSPEGAPLSEAEQFRFPEADPDGRVTDRLYVIGDLSGHALTAEYAVLQADRCAARILRQEPMEKEYAGPYAEPANEVRPLCVFTDPPLAKAGLSAEEAAAAGAETAVGTAPYYAVPAAVLDGAQCGSITIVREIFSDRILGAQIVGMNAPELIHTLIPAITGEITAAELAAQLFVHPSYAEGVRIALEATYGNSPGLPKSF